MFNKKILTGIISLTLGVCLTTTVFAVTTDPMIRYFYEPSLVAYHKSFLDKFKVSSPSVVNHTLTLEYACPMRGNNISPAIAWQGIPHGTTRLHLAIVDGVCTWGCDTNGKAYHWILDFPITAITKDGPITPYGILKNAGSSKALQPFTLINSSGKANYFGPCSPVGQPHAWVIQLTAYKLDHGKKVILAKTQSVPFLFPRSELVGKSN